MSFSWRIRLAFISMKAASREPQSRTCASFVARVVVSGPGVNSSGSFAMSDRSDVRHESAAHVVRRDRRAWKLVHCAGANAKAYETRTLRVVRADRIVEALQLVALDCHCVAAA